MPEPAAPSEAGMGGPPAPARRLGSRIDLTQGSLLRGIVRLSWPIVAGAFLNWLMGIADIKMVGYLGPEAIAAVGTSRGAIFTLMAIIFALSTGTQVLVARYTGEGDHDRVANVTRQAVILSVGFGVLLVPAGLWLSGPLLEALGAEGAVLAQGTAYMHAYFWGSVALMINFMIPAALNGAGDTLTPLLALVFVNAAHILLEWLLIFGVGPFPELGVAGAAWAVVASRSAAAVVMLWIVTSARFAIHMPVFSGWRVDLEAWGKMFYIGVPSSIQGFTRNLAYLLVLAVLNATPAASFAVAGYTVCGQIQMVAVMIGLALMSAAMTAVGQNMGAGDTARAERCGWTVMRISVVASVLLAGVFIGGSRWFIGFFTSDAEAMRWGVASLVWLSLALPFQMAGMAFSGALRGAGDTMSPLYASLLCTSVIGPALAWLLTIPLGMGPDGAWVGLTVALVLQAFVIGWLFKRGRWKQIRL